MKPTSLRPSFAGRKVAVTGSRGNVYTGVVTYYAARKPIASVNAAGKPCKRTKYGVQTLLGYGSILSTDTLRLFP